MSTSRHRIPADTLIKAEDIPTLLGLGVHLLILAPAAVILATSLGLGIPQTALFVLVCYGALRLGAFLKARVVTWLSPTEGERREAVRETMAERSLANREWTRPDLSPLWQQRHGIATLSTEPAWPKEETA